MTPGQAFTLLAAFIFFACAYSTARHGMLPYFSIMTAVCWLGIGVGLFVKIFLEAWK